MTNTNLPLSLLTSITAVYLVGNPNSNGALVTPTMKNGVPATDLMGNEIGSIRLEQVAKSLNGSYLNERKRVAFISGPLDTLKNLIKVNNLKEGSQFPGKIVIKESLAPMWPNQTSKINPQTQEAIGVTVGGMFHPVFMKMEYTEDLTQTDKLIRDEDAVIAWKEKYDTPAVVAADNVTSAATATVPD